MNYLSLEKLLSKIAKKIGGIPAFHQAFVDAIKQETDSIKAHTPDYDKALAASEYRYANQAALINSILKIIRQKQNTPNLSEKEINILSEYQRACQLALLEPRVRIALFTDYEITLTRECLDSAKLLTVQGNNQPLAEQMGLKLDTLGSFKDVIAYFREKRNEYRAAFQECKRNNNKTGETTNRILIQKLDYLLDHIITSGRSAIHFVHDDALLNLIEPFLLNNIYHDLGSFLGPYARTTDNNLKPIVDKLIELFYAAQTTPEAAAKLYANLFQLYSYFSQVVHQKTQALEQSKQQGLPADHLNQIEGEIAENQDALSTVDELLNNFTNMQSSNMRKSLQDTSDKISLNQIARTALSTMNLDESTLKLRTLLSQLVIASQQLDGAVKTGTDSFILGENRILLKKIIVEVEKYQKKHSSFFRNPLSKAHSTAKKLTESLENLAQQNPDFRLLQDEVHTKNNRNTLGLSARDAIAEYKVTTIQQLVAGLLSLRTSWQPTAIKIMSKRHQDRSEKLKQNIELIASATQLAQLPPDLSKLVALTRYHEASQGTVTDKMRSEAILRCVLQDLVDASNVRENGAYVSHQKKYAGILTGLIKSTRAHRTVEMRALIVPVQFDLRTIEYKSKKTTPESQKWADYIRDKLARIGKKLGEKIPDALQERYPGKIYYDGETIMKEFAKFLLTEDRKITLYNNNDFKELKKLVEAAIDDLMPSLPPEYQQYIKTSREDMKSAQKEGETISVSTSSKRTHYIGRH